ncbi:MAG: FecR family protein [Polaromonas sp.]|nr:FecR family protein [Polaromonas sp.]
MQQHFQLKNAVLLMALAAAYPLQAHALAGVAQFTAGDVNLRQSDGRTTTLSKGGDIDSGAAIVTGANGRAQVKFTDGGLVSLQPNTEFKISNYVDRNDPKEDRFLVDLLRGSMRAITGLIGKRNRDNYKLTTTTATIGIRGSGFKVGYNADGTLAITSELDKIEVCNQSGCIGLVAGESVRVIDSTSPPVRTSEQPKVATPPTEKEPTAVGEKVDSSGKIQAVAEKTPATKETTKPIQDPVHVPVQRTFSDIAVAAIGNNGANKYTISTTSTAPSTMFSDNKLLKLIDGTGGFGTWAETGTPKPESSFQSVGNVSDANFIGWGTWTTGQRDYTGTVMLDNVHYVAGRRTSTADMSALGSTTLNYTFVGGTATRAGVAGTLDSGSFSLALSTGMVINTTLNTSFGSISDSYSGTRGPVFTGGSGYVQGMFIGSSAAYAGLTYGKDLGQGLITGAAVFKK